MWEVFSAGSSPYNAMGNTAVVRYVSIYSWYKSKYKKVGVLPMRIVWSNVSSIGSKL